MGAGFTGKVSAKHSRFLKKVIYKVISYKEFLKSEICFKFSFMSNAVDQRSGIVHLERMQIFRKITIFYPNTHTFICILYFIYRLIWNSWTVLGNDSFLMKFQSFTQISRSRMLLHSIFFKNLPWKGWIYLPAGIYLLKVNKNTRTRCEICSELTIKIPGIFWYLYC